MVKICHVYWFYPPAAIGGIETFLQSVSEKYAEKGNDVTIVTGSYGYKSKKENNVNVIRTDIFERYRKDISSTQQESEACEFLTKVIEKNKIQILHVHNFHFTHNVPHILASLRAARNKNIPIVLHVHGPGSQTVSDFLLSRIGWDKVISVSKYVATEVYEKGVKGDSLEVIYNGTNTEWFKPGSKNEKLLEEIGVDSEKIILGTPSRLITSNGSIVERKGYFTIMKALSLLKERRDDFIWILTGGKFPNQDMMESAKNKMMDYARIYGIEDNVKICVEVPHEDMPSFYNSMDLMLLPSTDEPFGLSTIEAMSCGTVAIGANSGATTEIIRNKVDGFIIQPENHIELADLLVKLMANDDLRKDVGMNSRRTIVERFSIDKLVESLDKMYKGLLNE